MKKLQIIAAILILVVLASPLSFALEAPILNVTTSGINVSLSWTNVSGATEYNLIYAPYPYTGPNSIQSVNMGSLTSFNVDLWDGAVFYLAITATYGSETSGYSNIEIINISSSSQTSAKKLIKIEYDLGNDGIIENTEWLSYDSNGHLLLKENNWYVKYHTTNLEGVVTKVEVDLSKDGTIDDTGYFTLDSFGNVIKEEWSNYVNEYENDSVGNHVKMISICNGEYTVIYYQNDTAGNPVKYEVDVSNDGIINYSYEIANEYDSEGNLIKAVEDGGGDNISAYIYSYQ